MTFFLLGCQATLDRPDFDPEWSAEKALEQCDTNGDGLIDQTEARAAPGLLKVFEDWDTNGDKSISEQEFIERIAGYSVGSASVIPMPLTVTYKRRPLTDAEVTFEPEPFMSGGFETVKATTDQNGYANLSRPSAEEEGYPGIYLGLYRVSISKKIDGKEMLPRKYNTETQLGFDAGGQSRESGLSPRFDLK